MKYLEILVSLIFIFLLLSMFSSIIMEFISTFFRMRASTLQKSIAKILGATSVDEKIVKEFYEVPLIKMIGEDTYAFFSIFNKENLPHQIDSKTFKDAILYMIKNGKSEEGKNNKTSLQGANETATVAAVPKISLESFKGDAKKLFQFLLDKSDDYIPEFENEIERWYNVVQERTIAWYKRKVQYILIVIGFFIAILFNADSIRIISELGQNDSERTELVNAARDFVSNNQNVPLQISFTNSDTSIVHFQRLLKEHDSIRDVAKLDSLRKAILTQYDSTIAQSRNMLGWKNKVFPTNYTKCYKLNIVITIFGFLLTGFAVSLGATFWFDMLKKILDLKVLGSNK